MLKNKRRKTSIAFVIVILIAGITFSLSPVKALDGDPIVYMDPSEILDLPPSTNFTIALKIANVTDFYGFDIQMKWCPTIISYVSHIVKVPVETYADGVLHNPVLQLTQVIDENDSIPGAEIGTMAWFGFSSFNPAIGFDGSGIIFEMTFHVESLGSCWIEIVSSALSDSLGFPIAHDTQNGYFDNSPPVTPVDIFVNPSSIVDSTLLPCHNFSIEIDVEDAVGLYGFEFWISYNTTLLDVNETTVNPSFPQVDVEILEAQGKLRVNASLTSPPGISGNPSLANVKFHVTEVGESVLDLYNVTLVNESEEVIPYNEPGDGYFNNVLITKMFISPPELIAPTMKPGDIFTISMKIENAIDMYDYEFKLGYDTSILTCLGAVIIPPNNNTDFSVEMYINDTEAMLWVKVQYYPPAEPFSIFAAKTMTEITFQVQDYGQTILDLYDTKISDPYGNPKEHEVEDGFFATLLRDVAIMHVNVTSSNIVYPGRDVTIEVTAMNRGNMTVETFNVTVYYDDTPLETRNVTLNSWTSTILVFHWNTTGLSPCSNFTLRAEASAVPYEVNLSNNIFHDGWVKIKMIGDVNGDGVIDIFDAVLLLQAYGSHEGDPNWNPEADIAPQWGVVNLYDAVTLTSRYGQTCP